MVNMLKDLLEQVDNIYEQIGNFRRQKTSNGNDRNKKHGTRDEEFL